MASAIIEKAKYLRAKIEQLAETLTDEVALQYVALFKDWQTDTAYAVDDRVKYADVLYKCVQAHTSQGTLPTKVRLVKAMVFPVVMYGCESWTVKKTEC